MIKKILVSQPKPTSEKSPYFDIARKLDVEIVFRPFIKIEALTPVEFRQQKVSILDHTAVVFTSRNAIDNFFKLCKELRVTIPDDMKYFCLSETISLYIQKYVQYRKRKVFFGNGHIQDLEPLFAKHKTEKYFVPTSNVHTNEINALFDKYGITHSQAEMYRTVSTEIEADYVNVHFAIEMPYRAGGNYYLTGDFCGETDEHVYRIFTSKNNGDSFEELCVVPIEPYGRGYGAFFFDEKNVLHVYAYNANIIDSSSFPEDVNPFSSPLDRIWEVEFAK